MKKFFTIIAALTAVTLLAGCDTDNSDAQREGGQNVQDEQQQVSIGFNRLSDSQQIPTFDWSQERQTLIDVESIRATGATSTSAGYLEGVGMIWWCPSIGSAVPSTYQLSATSQYVDLPDDESRQLYPVDQGEPTGVYVGQSSGTWTICVDDNGNKFGKYWEGYVDVTVAIIDTYDSALRLRPADVTFQFTEVPEDGN